MQNVIYLDAEWPTKSEGIHMVGTLLNGDYVLHNTASSLEGYLSRNSDYPICGHWIIFADYPRIRDHWNVDISTHILVDTYTLACLWKPSSRGYSNSLATWGNRLGDLKGDFTDYDAPPAGESMEKWKDRMALYMEQDIRITEKLHDHITKQLRKDGFSDNCVVVEHQIASIVQEQVENGFYFDIDKATSLYVKLTAVKNNLIRELQEIFPPITIRRWSPKTDKELKPKIIEFNPGSRKQIAARLIAAGATLTELTPGGSHKVDEGILDKLNMKEADKINEYLMVDKRISQLDQWFYYYNEDTHRIHGKVNPIGTNTHRQSQSKPNLAQIPAVGKPYGAECRGLFTVPKDGKLLVGIDASSLELRLFANRLGDSEYIKVVEDGDVHTYNMEMAGLKNRDQAKTFIYAFLYGAGDGKLSEILKVSLHEARRVRSRFNNRIPGLKEFRNQLEAEVKKNGSITLLDGSKVWVESEHSILNYQLQGDGACVMKQALVNFYPDMFLLGGKLVVQAHDEWQVETPYHCVDILGTKAVEAIEKVTKDLDMKVQLTGEYKIGGSWADTH